MYTTACTTAVHRINDSKYCYEWNVIHAPRYNGTAFTHRPLVIQHLSPNINMLYVVCVCSAPCTGVLMVCILFYNYTAVLYCFSSVLFLSQNPHQYK